MQRRGYAGVHRNQYLKSSQPTIVTSLSDATRLNCDYNMQIVGKYAYVTNDQNTSGQADFTVIDISDPTHPVIIGSLEDQADLGLSSGISVVGNVAFTSPAEGNMSRIAAIDITDPTNPRLISTTAALPDGSAPASISQIDVINGYAFYSANLTLGVVDVSNPQSMVLAGSATSTDIGTGYGLAVSGSYAYVLNEGNDFVVADISAFVAPPIVSPPPPPAPSGGGGMIVGSGPLAPAPVPTAPPRPQIDYPNGTIVYLGATTTASTSSPATSSASTTPAAQLTTTPPSYPVSTSSVPLLLTQNRQLWDEGPDILALQQFLNDHGFTLAQSGPGSPGEETDRFGLLTYAALVKFQDAHAAEILTPVGLTQGSGYFGPLTRAAIAGMSTTSTQ